MSADPEWVLPTAQGGPTSGPLDGDRGDTLMSNRTARNRVQSRRGAGQTVEDLGDKAEDTAARAEESKAFGVLVVVGLIAYGLIHLAVGWIALQLAWRGGSGTEADQRGALEQLAQAPLGPLWLWIAAIGLFALVLWRFGLAAWGFAWKRGFQRTRKRWGSVFQGIVYGVLGASAINVVLGSGSSSNSQRSLSGQLMQHTYGRVLLGVIAAVIVGIGVHLWIRGITGWFADELRDGGTGWVIVAGRIGYIAKGVAYAIVGFIVGWAALRHHAQQAGGLDSALRAVKQQPYGPYLLTALAIGFASFGVYCFGWAGRARRS